MGVEKMKIRKITEKERIAMYQMFIGLVNEEIGPKKTIKLLRKAKQEISSYEKANG